MPPPQGTPNPLEGPADFTMTTLVHSTTYPSISPSLTANLTSHSILIIGASKGLGRAMALSFARAGASHIAIAARSDLSATSAEILLAAAEAGRPEPQVLKVKLDVTSQGDTEAAAKAVGEAFGGKLDVLVNNAGVLEGLAVIGESEPEVWWRNWTVNVKGPYLSTRSFLPLLLASTLKTVINVASVGAHLVMPKGSAYMSSKLALCRLTEYMATEYAEQGLIAFAIHPGNILTDIVGQGKGMNPNFRALYTETPELSADSLVFLAKERREWLSGRYVNVTWDLPELCGEEKVREIVEGDKLKVRLVV